MLHVETVEPIALSILNQLMALPEMSSFYLVGGTALSLQYGHRVSVDLDLFSSEKFEHNYISEVLQKEFKLAFRYEGGFSKFGLFCYISGVKVDIVHYPHSIVFDTLEIEKIRMYNPKEIFSMKIQAILGRGKKKDFWDIAELLNHFSVEELINFHQKKYPSQQLLISIPQSLTYFADADDSEDPISLKGQTWESVKKIVQQHVNDYLR
jgi:predicted nucleotidyltransferase component of viral defense system